MTGLILIAIEFSCICIMYIITQKTFTLGPAGNSHTVRFRTFSCVIFLRNVLTGP